MRDTAFLWKSLIPSNFDSIQNIHYIKASEDSTWCMSPVKPVT